MNVGPGIISTKPLVFIEQLLPYRMDVGKVMLLGR